MAINVLIVDDSTAVRAALNSMLCNVSDIKVQAAVGDPFRAAEVIKRQIPDVILLDIEMPKMDGLSFLRRIMSQRPIPTIICSSLTVEGSPKCLEALKSGAFEVVGKPSVSTVEAFEDGRLSLVRKIRAAANARLSPGGRRRIEKAKLPSANNLGDLQGQAKLSVDTLIPHKDFRSAKSLPPLVAIGASTGGTVALEEVLRRVDFPVPGIVVVQHMPKQFTATFAERLNSVSRLRVKEAEHGEPVARNSVYIAPGDSHLTVDRSAGGYLLRLLDGPLISRHRPSVDVLFRSCVRAAGPFCTGILMTGMGDDGAQGLLDLKTTGAATFAQDESSSVVWGMPGAACRLGAAQKVLPLKSIPELLRKCGARREH